MLYILTKYLHWILKYNLQILCVQIRIWKFYFHQNEIRLKCNSGPPLCVINPAWNMDLMGGKAFQITFFKLLNYNSLDTNWFFVLLSAGFKPQLIAVESKLFKGGNYVVGGTSVLTRQSRAELKPKLSVTNPRQSSHTCKALEIYQTLSTVKTEYCEYRGGFA